MENRTLTKQAITDFIKDSIEAKLSDSTPVTKKSYKVTEKQFAAIISSQYKNSVSIAIASTLRTE